MTTDHIQVLLDMVEDEIPDILISNGGGDPNVPPWYAMAYWYEPSNAPPEDGHWELDVTGLTLRELLCNIIAHPRFVQ
jgi:hypothetical protein